MHDLAEALPDSNGDAIHGLNSILSQLEVKRALKDYVMQKHDIEKAAALTVKNQYSNPGEVRQEKVRGLIRRAWEGEPARTEL